MMYEWFDWIPQWAPFFALHDIIVIILVPVLLLRRKEPSATIAWLVVIIAMPFVGAIVYLIFGNDRIRRSMDDKIGRKRELRSKLRGLTIGRVSPNLYTPQIQIFRLLDDISPLPAVAGNAVQIFTDIHENYREQLAAIREAKHHVHVEYYIFQTDLVGERFCEELMAASARGVKVRLVYDGVGSHAMGYRFKARFKKAGVEIAPFIPLSMRFLRRINFRNHRKIVVVDGRVGFTGGANIGEEYLGHSSIGNWRDTHLKVTGPAVVQLQRVFAEDWAFAGGVELTESDLYPELKQEGDIIAQIVPGGPDQETSIYHELYFTAISESIRQIRVTTPFFVPTESIQTALCCAARRGVDVRILVPKKNTKLIVKLAAQSYYEELLEAGVKIFEFEGGFLHSKILTMDGRWASVGTANFDIRSMKLNFEIGAVLYDQRIAAQLDAIFDEEAADSDQILLERWKQRSLPIRVAQNFSRLFSPVL